MSHSAERQGEQRAPEQRDHKASEEVLVTGEQHFMAPTQAPNRVELRDYKPANGF